VGKAVLLSATDHSYQNTGLRAGPALEVHTMIAKCPECDADIELQDALEGEIVDCPECGVELEVVSVKPLTLELAPEEEEDWGE
jgi:alpha-aminoadipate/glutamate carrier protein LysW